MAGATIPAQGRRREACYNYACSNSFGAQSMSVFTSSRYAAVILLAALAGCSSKPSAPDGHGQTRAEDGRVANDCGWFRSRCMFEGSYESGERAYAEQEARRLNQAELERLRRASSR